MEKAAIVLFLHIFARLPIFSGWHTDVFIKHGVEMANAAESQVIRNISDGNGAVGQQVLCFADAAFHDILHGRYAKFVFKHMRQIIRIDVQRFADNCEGNRFAVMCVEILLYAVCRGRGRRTRANDSVAAAAENHFVCEKQKG